MSDEPPPKSEISLYQTADGHTCVQCRFENETVWMTQPQMAELFLTTAQNVTLHLKSIFAEAELVEAATSEDYLQVRPEGQRRSRFTPGSKPIEFDGFGNCGEFATIGNPANEPPSVLIPSNSTGLEFGRMRAWSLIPSNSRGLKTSPTEP